MLKTDPVIISKQTPLLEFLKKQQENRRFSNTIEITITLIVISFFAVFAIKPAVTTISSLLGEIKSKQILVKEMRTKINNIVAAQESFALVQERYQIIESALPSSPRYSHATIQLYGAVAQTGTAVDTLTYELQQNSKLKMPNVYLAAYGINLNTATGFQNALKLLDSLVQNRRLLDLQSINLTAPKDNAPTDKVLPGQVMFTLNTRTYYWNTNINEKK